MHRFVRLLLMVSIVVVLLAVSTAGFGKKGQVPVHPTAPKYSLLLKSGSFVPPATVDTALVNAALAKAGVVHVLVQLYEIPATSEQKNLAAHGLKLLSYVADRGWFAAVDRRFKYSTQAYPALRYLGSIEPEYKLSAQAAEMRYEDFALEDNGRVWLNVRFFDDVDLNRAAAVATAYGARVITGTRSINTLTLAMMPEDVEYLAGADAVQWIEQVAPGWTANNDQNRALVKANVVQAAPYNLDGSGIKAFIFDAEIVDGTHDDLAGRVTAGESSSGWGNEHPTHVAGTLGGTGLLSSGLYKGMAPAVTFYSLRFDWTDPIFYNNPADTEASFDLAINTAHADLSSTSLGSNVTWNGYDCDWWGDYESSAALLDAIAGGSLGRAIPMMWAAGNERGGWCPGNFGSVAPPADAKNTIVVGGVNSNDSTAYANSTWGPTDDGRMRPDIVAPACQTNGDFGVTSSVPNDTYTAMCGTSMATPTTAGVVALMLQQWEAQKADPPLPSTIKAILAHTATDLGRIGPDYKFGYGLINAQAAVDFVIGGSVIEGEISQGETLMFPVENTDWESISYTLAWDDYPGTPNTVPNLVNDLDLQIVGPDGATSLPWLLNPSQPDAQVTFGVNSRDNLEQVPINNTPAGIYVIKVIGTAVPHGPQKFSLVGLKLGLLTCDNDGDTFIAEFCGGSDCNDAEAAINPDATEICDDGIDNNCNDLIDGEDPACQTVDDDTTPDDDTTADDDTTDDDIADDDTGDDDTVDDDAGDDDAADDDAGADDDDDEGGDDDDSSACGC